MRSVDYRLGLLTIHGLTIDEGNTQSRWVTAEMPGKQDWKHTSLCGAVTENYRPREDYLAEWAFHEPPELGNSFGRLRRET